MHHSRRVGVYEKTGITEEEKGQLELSLDVSPSLESASPMVREGKIKQ
jgi:hypothetical protein